VNDVGALDDARRDLQLTVHELWMAYFALGGHHNALTMDAYIAEKDLLAADDHDIIVHALNETYAERGGHRRLPYRAASQHATTVEGAPSASDVSP